MTGKFIIQILNYLSDDEKLRETRLKFHREQLEWWLDRTDIEILIYAMNYNEDDYYDHPRVSYKTLPKTPTGRAYNLRFEYLYNSDYDYSIMMDDDCILYDHSSSADMFREMSTHLDDYKGVDFFFPVFPVAMPFNCHLQKYNGDDNHIFLPNKNLKGTLYVVKNFRKEGTTEVLTDDRFTVGEDGQTAIEAITLGKTVYVTPSMILKEFNHKASHFAIEGHANIRPGREEMEIMLGEKYAEKSLVMNKKGTGFDTRKFLKRWWPDKKPLIIPKTGAWLDDDLWSDT